MSDELKPFMFVALAETPPNKIGYRLILVAAHDEDAALGFGLKEVERRCPDSKITTPMVSEITPEKLKDIGVSMGFPHDTHADLIAAADELAKVIDTPNQSCSKDSRYHYDWDRVDAVLTPYMQKRGET